MPSTTWGTIQMDRAPSIPWVYPDCVQTWLSPTPTQGMSRGRYFFIKPSNFIVKVYWTKPPPVPGPNRRGPRTGEGPRRQVREAPEPWSRRLSVLCQNGAFQVNLLLCESYDVAIFLIINIYIMDISGCTHFVHVNPHQQVYQLSLL